MSEPGSFTLRTRRSRRLRHVILDCRLRPEETWILCSCGFRLVSTLARVEVEWGRHQPYGRGVVRW